MKDHKSCSELLCCLISKLCSPSNVEKKHIDSIFGKMHGPYLKAFHGFEKRQMLAVCGPENVMPLQKWPPFVHRLIVLSHLYEVLLKCGNEGLASMIEDPVGKSRKLLRLISLWKEGEIKIVKRSHICPILPQHKLLPIDTLQSSAAHTLGKIDIHPNNEREDANMEMICMIMERYLTEEFPLDVLLLIDEDWEERKLVWKTLRNARSLKSLRKWCKVIQDIPKAYQRYVKFALMLCKRHWQFESRYCDSIKCVNQVKSDRPLVSSMVTFCGYCREFLTFVDMSKRPPSFGHYMNADNLTQFCHRDDSNKLCLLQCFDAKQFVNLQFGHPDRQSFSICSGRRMCFNLVGYPDGRCPECSHALTTEEIHRGSCLEGGGSCNDICKGCQEILKDDEKIVEKIAHEKMLIVEKEKEVMKVKEQDDKEKIVIVDTNKRQKMRYLFDQALQKKQRRLLTK